jgi:predicted nucleic acid-binding Zn ribbon protein
MSEKRLCPVCNEPILGRVDKKFCSDQCRNSFNNQRYSSGNLQIQKINRVLKKNHHILSSLNTNGKTKVSRSKLLKEGFDFNYFTSIYETQKGNTYRLCYNEGYLSLSDDSYLLIHWNDGE